MSLERRIEELERLIVQPEDEEAELRRAVMRDIMNELSRLKACRARNGYRGGTPPTPIHPTDPAGDALGYPYTRGQLLEHAIQRVFEREPSEAADTAELVEGWTSLFRRISEESGHKWDAVEVEGPPERTLPWRGGY